MVGKREEDFPRRSHVGRERCSASCSACRRAASARGGRAPAVPETANAGSASAEADALVAEALARNPELAAARAEASALAARAPAAGVLSDPMLSVGYENDGSAISLGTEPMSRLIFVVQQAFPFPGKLGRGGEGRERRCRPDPLPARAHGSRPGRRRAARPRGPPRGPREPASRRRADRHLEADRRDDPRPLRSRDGDAAGRPPRPEREDAPPPAASARPGRRGSGPRRAAAPPRPSARMHPSRRRPG